MSDTETAGSRRVRRAVAVALVAVMVGSVATAGVGAVSASSTAASTSTALQSSNPVKLVFVSSSTGNVTFLREDGTKVGTNVSDADIVGSMADLDGDGVLEAPYVTSQGEIYAVDVNNETQFVANKTYNSNTKLGVGDWTGDGTPEVLYANTSANNYLYYANLSGSPTRITSESAVAVFGTADFDGDGGTDVVYQGTTSGNLWYYTGSSAVDTGYGNFAEGGAGGAPSDFYRDGTYWVPAMDGSGYPEIVNASGHTNQLNGNSQDKTPVAGVDWAGDSRLELVHLKSSNIKYTYLNGTTATLYDANGNNIGAAQGAGVAGVALRNETTLSVTDFQATATGNQNVTVDVTTNEELSALNVSLSGPENASLTLTSDFTTGDSSAPYTYTATYNGSTDGDYTAQLERAESTDGDMVSDSRTDSATVDDVVPNVSSADIVDATDGDGEVEPGDTVSVTATVTGDVGTVAVDLSAFDAGTVQLTHDSGDAYSASAQVGAGATGGNQSATVVADDGQGNSDSAVTGTLYVDASTLTVSLGGDVTVSEDEQVQFSVASVSNATGEVSFDWSMGDGGSRSCESVVYTYVTPGTYTVTVEATDESGETATASMTVEVEADSSGSGGEETTTAQSTQTTEAPQTTATTENTATENTATTESADTTENTPTENTPTPTTAAETTENTATGTPANEQTPGEAPGFGVAAAVVALAAAALLARRE